MREYASAVKDEVFKYKSSVICGLKNQG